MKYIRHNLHIIRTNFRSNGWVLAELFLVFVILWFLCDSLGCMKYTFYRPLGYSIDHVYKLTVIRGGESQNGELTLEDKLLNVLGKLEQEPTVESVAMCYYSLPMSGNNSYNSLAVQDSMYVNARSIYATGGYVSVFRMSDDPQRPFATSPSGEGYVTLSEGAAERFRKKLPSFSLDTPLSYGDPTDSTSIRQAGRIGAFRTYRYGTDASWFFYRIDENMIKNYFSDEMAQIVFRVKPEADKPSYRENFLRDTAPRLDIDNLFVADVAPYVQQQEEYEIMNGDTDKVNTQSIVVLFLLFNIFLGLMGTFWLRTRKRRGEIALRMALGSSRKRVFSMLIGEGLLLLTMAALPAMLVCFNVGIGEFTIGTTELITTWPVEWSFLRFLLGTLGTWLLMAAIVSVGIWFPARRAMRIQPAEALHDE